MCASHFGGTSCGAQALGRVGFSSCYTWAQQLWPMGLIALRHVGSSWARDRTCVPCIARWILNHWTTREAPIIFFEATQFVLTAMATPGREKRERQLCSHSKQHPSCSFLGAVRAWASNPGIWVQILNLGTQDIFLNLHKPQPPHLYNGDKGAPCFLGVSWE